MSRRSSSAGGVLDRVYQDLDLVSGTLLDAASSPDAGATDQQWRAVGDWLLLAERVGAERMFFVDEDPVLVFSTLAPDATAEEILDMYRRTWCLARPRCLFLAIGEDLHVYALTEPPARDDGTGLGQPLRILERTADVSDVLAAFHRERIESGVAFDTAGFRSHDRRADEQLLRDVRAATDALINGGLTRRAAHTLIERAILVRYLEDREVLTPDYFEKVAAPNAAWRRLLADRREPIIGPDSRFLTCLESRPLSLALFGQLAEDFNGDLFVDEGEELAGITEDHLHLLQGMLQGTQGAGQEQLFLWAYDFSIVPTSLISTMYELFHHQEVDGKATNTYFTPPQLVEFMLSGVLSEQVLDSEPRVCDPACGSGVFLVEAFRRIVRHDMTRTRKPPTSGRLRELLVTRIVGVDIDEAAVRLAAFSLYLALLNYQSPKDIHAAGPLPALITDPNDRSDLRPLTVANAFSRPPRPIAGADAASPVDWASGGFDVVVANPPWTEPPKGPKSVAGAWAKSRDRRTGDNSPSQLFLWRALDLLKDGGTAALLVHAKSLLNTRSTSQAFRRQWLEAARLEHIVNFTDVRADYFKGARAPFTLVQFARRTDGERDNLVIYESARRSSGNQGYLAYARLDRRVVRQASLHAHDFLWKTYSVGGHRDEALVLRLGAEGCLGELVSEDAPPRFGWQNPTGNRPSQPPSRELQKMPSIKRLRAWGPFEDAWLTPLPKTVKHEPHLQVFTGRRLVIGMGVVDHFGLHARIVTEPLAFQHSMLGFPLAHRPAWHADVALGTLLSSVGRYWLAMVSGGWGVWRDQVRKEQLLKLPLRLTRASDPHVRRIISAVKALPRAAPTTGQPRALWDTPGPSLPSLESILQTLDQATADLFDMTSAERDLVRDFWAAQEPAATELVPDFVLRTGRSEDLASGDSVGLAPYLETFLATWNHQLGDDGEFGWEVRRDADSRTIAVVFETRSRGEHSPPRASDDAHDSWPGVLKRLGEGLTHQRAASLRSHGILRVVSDTAIVIVKRDEQRLWTTTAAREDAEATTLQAMALEPA
jgi:hypothetical protein